MALAVLPLSTMVHLAMGEETASHLARGLVTSGLGRTSMWFDSSVDTRTIGDRETVKAPHGVPHGASREDSDVALATMDDRGTKNTR
jgi:hypothetical protein